MHIMSFSEREYIDVPEEAIIENGQSYFGLSNTLFEANRGGELMNEYLDERVYAEELGFVWCDAQRASPDAVLWWGGHGRRSGDFGPDHQAGENCAAWQPPAGW